MKKYFKLKSADRVNTISGIMWIPEGEVKCILQLSHGMIEYIERYDDFAKYLNTQGILVVGNDHIGHGDSVSSPEDFGYFGEKDGGAIIVHDLYHITKIMKRRYEGVPYIMLGHSMGSFMLRRYIINHSEAIDGAIIMGTGNQSGALLKAGRFICKIFELTKGKRYRSDFVSNLTFGAYNKRITEDMTGNWQTSDQEILDKIKDVPAANYKFTVSGFRQLFETISYVEDKKNIDKIRKDLPILVVSGDADPVGNYGKDVKKAHKALCKAGIENVTLKLFEGDRHEVINEKDRAEVYEYLYEWIMSAAKTAKENSEE